MSFLSVVPDYFFPVKFTHNGYYVKIDKKSNGYTATYKPADPLYGEKCYLVGMLSEQEYKDYVDIASAYVESLSLPSVVTEEIEPRAMSFVGLLTNAKAKLDRVIRGLRKHVDADLPSIAKFDFNDYISFLENHGLKNETVKSIRYVNNTHTF